MAQIDSDIYFRSQAPDIFGSVQQGLNARDLMNKRNKEKAVDQAYQSAIVTNPDGTQTFDKGMATTALAKVGGREFIDARQKFAEMDRQESQANYEKKIRDLDVTSRLLGSAKDQASWESGLAEASKYGLDISKEPKVYDQGYRDRLLNQSVSYLDKLRLEQQAREESRREREVRAQEANAGIARQEKREEKLNAIRTPFGLANTPEDAKQLKEAFEAKKNFDGKLDQMIALRQKHGGGATLNREDVNRGKQLSKDLLLEYKNMAKLGVLSKSDEDIINAIIPEDPLQYNSPIEAMSGQDSTMARLKAFKEDSDRDFSTKVSTRTQSGVQTAAQQQQKRRFDPDVVAYASKHGISPEEAQQIKAQRTSQQAGR